MRMHSSPVQCSVAEIFVPVGTSIISRRIEYCAIKVIIKRVLSTTELFCPNAVEEAEKMLKNIGIYLKIKCTIRIKDRINKLLLVFRILLTISGYSGISFIICIIVFCSCRGGMAFFSFICNRLAC